MKEIYCHFCANEPVINIGFIKKKEASMCVCSATHSYLATALVITRLNKILKVYKARHKPVKEWKQKGLHQCTMCWGYGNRVGVEVSRYSEHTNKLTSDVNLHECRWCNGTGHIDWLTKLRFDCMRDNNVAS